MGQHETGVTCETCAVNGREGMIVAEIESVATESLSLIPIGPGRELLSTDDHVIPL